MGIDIDVNWNDVIRQTSLRRFKAHKGEPIGPAFSSWLTYLNCLRHEPIRRYVRRVTVIISCRHVQRLATATLRLFPGITAATIRAFMLPPTRGVVLETFGSGNAPQRPELMAAFKEACDRGIVIVAISQCSKGSVSDAYETGRSLSMAGVVSGGDMTPEVSSSYHNWLCYTDCTACCFVRSVLLPS